MRLEQVRADWTVLGSTDPLWAVLVTPEGRHNRWDPADFLATGAREIDGVLAHLRGLGITPGTGAALDFGCGAGRLSIALSAHVERVVGIDISAPMLETARRLDTSGRCEFVENDRPDLAVLGERSFDLVVSSLVLQHLPPQLAETFLAELLRVLAPGGAMAVQVASGQDRSARGLLGRVLPRPAMRFLQRRVLRYPAPMDMWPTTRATVERLARAAGAQIVDAVPETMYGGHWRYTRYYLVKPTP